MPPPRFTIEERRFAKSNAQRRIVILTDGHTNPITAKTASCVVRYKPDEVVALLDTTQPGRTSQELLGVGGANSRRGAPGRRAGPPTRS